MLEQRHAPSQYLRRSPPVIMQKWRPTKKRLEISCCPFSKPSKLLRLFSTATKRNSIHFKKKSNLETSFLTSVQSQDWCSWQKTFLSTCEHADSAKSVNCCLHSKLSAVTQTKILFPTTYTEIPWRRTGDSDQGKHTRAQMLFVSCTGCYLHLLYVGRWNNQSMWFQEAHAPQNCWTPKNIFYLI